MRSGTKIIRFGALLVAFLALSGMAGCPKSSGVPTGNQHTDGPPDHSGSGSGMDRMGGGM